MTSVAWLRTNRSGLDKAQGLVNMVALLMREEANPRERKAPRLVGTLEHPRTRSPATARSALFGA